MFYSGCLLQKLFSYISTAKYRSLHHSLQKSTFSGGEVVTRLSNQCYIVCTVLYSLGPVPCLHSYALRTALKGSVSRSPTVRILTKDKVLLVSPLTTVSITYSHISCKQFVNNSKGI